LDDYLDNSRNKSLGSAQGWTHKRNISNVYTDPSTINDATKNGWPTLEETQPTTSNFVNTSVNAGADTDYVYLAVKVPSAEDLGTWDEWNYVHVKSLCDGLGLLVALWSFR